MTAKLIMWACAGVLYGSSAAAAIVVPYAGAVFVSHGNGFQKIDGATPVKVGDLVMVSPDGFARVRLDDGNVIAVEPGEVLSVPAKVRAKEAVLPDRPRMTQAGVLDILAAGGLAIAGVAGAAALAASGAGTPPLPAPVPASP